MKFNKTILAAVAVILPLSAGIGSALSYFTANTTAAGGYAVEVGEPQTEITETFGKWTKHVTIRNTGDIAVYVRAKAFKGNRYELEYSGAGWASGEGGYYYYDTVLEAGAATNPLDIKIIGMPENATDKDAFNVVVIYERTPVVQYNEEGSVKLDNNGKPMPDWNYSVTQQSEFPINPGAAAPETPNMPADENEVATELEGGDES